MPIPIPVSYTKIATATWGIPITNEVNRLTPLVDGHTTSISALQTATAKTSWTQITFQNGWSNAYPVTPGQYRKIGDVVELRGMISGGNNNTVIGALPAGFRSAYDENMPSIAWDGGKWTAAAIKVTSGNGELIYTGLVSPASWVVLSACQFSTIA